METEDRELLELAAKAAGLELSMTLYPNGDVSFSTDEGFKPASGIGAGLESKGWNPLVDDGDALRLAVNLQLELSLGHCGAVVRQWGWRVTAEEQCHPDSGQELACARRAIVRAAAEIGRAMQ